MPPTDDTPTCLKPFRYHGVEFLKESTDEMLCECPFCGKNKFYVGLVDKDEKHFAGGWRCQVCGTGGNHLTFIRLLHAESWRITFDYKFLEGHRGLPADVMRAWGVCRSVTTGDWLVPGYLVNGEIGNLSKYLKMRNDKGEEFWSPIPTPTLAQCYFRPAGEWDESKPDLLITEGCWDGMALWGSLRESDPSSLATKNIISVPGCQTFLDPWKKLTHGKNVTILFDNDHPKRNIKTGTVTHPGYDGMVKLAGTISEVEESEKPVSISYIDWSGEGKPFTDKYPDGFDVRDHLSLKNGNSSSLIKSLLELIKPVPSQWVDGKAIQRGSGKAKPIEAEKCTSWKVLVNACRKAMKWNDNLEGAMAVCLASIASVKYRGKGKLWVKLVSPPASGKTMLLEMMIAANRYCIMESDFRGFYSFWNPENNGDEGKDYSLAGKLFDRTLITKDGDTILQSAYKETILSQARDLFDGQAANSAKNDIKRQYAGLLFTWILAGTNALRQLDTSELGQRFIDYCIMEKIDFETERDIIRRAIRTEVRNSAIQSNCQVESTMDVDYLRATKLCIGYIHHLKSHAELGEGMEFSSKNEDRCLDLAQFVSFMRARPSKNQKETETREMGTRLGQQFSRLARFLALVMNKKSVDRSVMQIVEKVAFDTARGRTLEIVKAVSESGTMGLDLRGVVSVTKQITHEESPYLEFLTKIEALEKFDNGVPSVAKNQYARWRLTESFRKLFKEVMRGK